MPTPTTRQALIVSLEAIFLSTFVMIGQNRQADFQQAKAEHDYAEEPSVETICTTLERPWTRSSRIASDLAKSFAARASLR